MTWLRFCCSRRIIRKPSLRPANQKRISAVPTRNRLRGPSDDVRVMRRTSDWSHTIPSWPSVFSNSEGRLFYVSIDFFVCGSRVVRFVGCLYCPQRTVPAQQMVLAFNVPGPAGHPDLHSMAAERRRRFKHEHMVLLG